MAREHFSDEKWVKIEAMLPGKASDNGATVADNRRFMEAVLWIARTGAPWRDLPAEGMGLSIPTPQAGKAFHKKQGHKPLASTKLR